MKSATDKRTYTREGFLLADAVIGKTGDLPYTRGELNLPGNPEDVVMLARSRAVLEKALPTMEGKPVTIGHPSPFVGTGDATSKAVGAIVSMPKIDADGMVKARVSIYDRKAIEMIERGEDELSPGFVFTPKFESDNRGAITNMNLNHLAIVPKGRAGEAVRVMDHLPPNLIGISKEIIPMGDNEKLAEAIKTAVADAFKAKPKAEGLTPDQIAAQVGDSVNQALKPVLDELASVKEKQAKDEAEAKAKEAEDAKAKEIKEAVDEAVKVERARQLIIADAKPFIAEDDHEKLETMEPADILRAAIGDAVEGADKMDLATLHGVMLGLKASGAKATDEEPTGSFPIRKATDQSKKDRKTMANIVDMRFKKARGMDEDDEEMD